jgi:hypothetical protein
MARVFGPGRLEDPDPEDPKNWFRDDQPSPITKGAPGSTISRIQEVLDDK